MIRCTYHCIKDSWDGLPHRLCFDRDSEWIGPSIAWAREQCGEPSPYENKGRPYEEPVGRWAIHNGGRMISFRDMADAFAFRVRWG